MTILYHYCSTTTFHAMLKNRSIWLSSVTQSNDYMEGKLVAQALKRLCDKDGLSSAAYDRIQYGVTGLETMFDGLAFCLSANGDLLSQWRGYANDASGVSIGFSEEYLTWLQSQTPPTEMGMRLRRIAYTPHDHDQLIEPVYREVKRCIDKGATEQLGRRSLLTDTRSDAEIEKDDTRIKDARTEMNMMLLKLFGHLYSLKSDAFEEEQEWRLLSYFIKAGADECDYRVRGERLVPFRKFELLEKDAQTPTIAEVVLGPCHRTPEDVIELALRFYGFNGAEVKLSKASYRT